MYADDTTLFCTYDKFESFDDKNIETIENNINKELSRPLALSPSLPLSLSPSRPLALSPSLPLSLSP